VLFDAGDKIRTPDIIKQRNFIGSGMNAQLAVAMVAFFSFSSLRAPEHGIDHVCHLA
jgi:hypothetical protein